MPELVSHKIVNIRKPHVCWGCGRTINPPYDMQCVTSVNLGKIGNAYWCHVCQKMLDDLYTDTDDWSFKELMDIDPGLWEDYRKDVEDD